MKTRGMLGGCVVRQAIAVGLLIGALAYSTGSAWANGAEVISTGAVLVPVESGAVQLKQETVNVFLPDLDGRGGHVECTYWLRNPTSTEASFSMAFVTGDRSRNDADASRPYRDSRFRVLSDNTELTPRLQAIQPAAWGPFVSEPPDSLQTWDVLIGPGEVQRLQISYEFMWSYRRDGTDSRYFFRYNARPAGLWAGPIELADIYFTVGGVGGSLLRCILDDDGCAPA